MTLMRSHYVLSSVPEDHKPQVREGILILGGGGGSEVSRLFHNTFHCEMYHVTMLI